MKRPRRIARRAAPRSASAAYSREAIGSRLDRLLRKVTRLENRLESLQPQAARPAPLAVLIEEAMTPDLSADAPLMQHVRANAAAREALIREFGLLSSADVAELAGSTAGNRAALAHRWKSTGQIFGLAYRGEEGFPAFQFDPETRRPRAAVREVVARLAPVYGGWSLALWFLSANAFLGGVRPVDRLVESPQKVVEAARAEREMLAEEFDARTTAPAGAARATTTV
jgi:hypothetical protein